MENDLKRILGTLLLATCIGSATAAPGTFASDPAVIDFARDMEQRHGFNADALLKQFGQSGPNAKVLQLIKPPSSPTQRSWERYRPRFLNDRRIDGGVRFWQENGGQLARASALYGVPEEIIVAINSEGGYKIKGESIAAGDVAGLRSAIAAATGSNNKAVLVLQADASAKHQAVVSAINAARLAGLSQITFATQGTGVSLR